MTLTKKANVDYQFQKQNLKGPFHGLIETQSVSLRNMAFNALSLVIIYTF